MAAAGPLGDPERAELERLRAEVAQLRHRPRRPSAQRARAAGAVVLVLLGALLAPAGVLAVWARGQLTDTDRYVATVAPLASDPAVQQAVTARLTDLVFHYVDVAGLTRTAVGTLGDRGTLPPEVAVRLQSLAVPLEQGVRSFTEDRIGQAVRSDAFARAWVEANRSVHEQLVAALTGRGGAVVLQGDEVQLQLGPFVAVVRERLVEQGFQLAERIPTVDVTLVVFRGEQVAAAQRAFDLVDRLGWWLPLLSLLLLGAGVFLARDRWRALTGAGAALAVAMLLGGTALAVARQAYLREVPAGVLPPAAAAALFDTLVRSLRDSLRSLALLGAIAAVAGYLTGRSPAAVAVRARLAGSITTARAAVTAAGLPPLEAFSTWTARSLGVLRAVTVVVAALVLVAQPVRTPELVGGLTATVLAVLLVLQFVAAGAPRPVRA